MEQSGFTMELLHTIWVRAQDPSVIFYWPWILSAFVMTVLWLFFQKHMSLPDALREVGRREVWLRRSTVTDICMSAVYVMLIYPLSRAMQDGIHSELSTVLTPFAWVPVTFHLHPMAEALIVAGLTTMTVDSGTYVVHRAMHRWRVLWEIHAVHHSAQRLTFFTTHRQHFLEPFMLNSVRAAFTTVGLVVFYAIFPQQSPTIVVWGLGLGFFVYMWTANLHHSHVPVRYPPLLRLILISPHVHHLHHSLSPRHQGKNFGVIYSIWDRLCGTYHEEDLACGDLTFGLDENPYGESILRGYLVPLVRIFRPGFGDPSLPSLPGCEKRMLSTRSINL